MHPNVYLPTYLNTTKLNPRILPSILEVAKIVKTPHDEVLE